MEQLEKVEVILTRDAPWDEEMVRGRDRSDLRRVQIVRMSEEAYDQEAYLTQEDLAKILGVSVRQIRRDIAVLQQQGVRIYLRGMMKDISRGVSWVTYGQDILTLSDERESKR